MCIGSRRPPAGYHSSESAMANAVTPVRRAGCVIAAALHFARPADTSAADLRRATGGGDCGVAGYLRLRFATGFTTLASSVGEWASSDAKRSTMTARRSRR